MNFEVIGVCGAGQMGSGIALVVAKAGLRTILYDAYEEALKRGEASVRAYLERQVKKGSLAPEQARAVGSNIFFTPKMEDLREASFVIEAVTEDRRIKEDVFHQIDRLTDSHTIIASNTSSISITELASMTTRPGKVIGMHFMNPATAIDLVEVIDGLLTEEETHKATVELARRLGKTPVSVKDSPGFISNRLLIPMLNEAAFCLMEGNASAEDIDAVMRLGMKHPMGPLALADLIGLDTVLSIMEVLYDSFKDPKYRPCPLLKKMVNAGLLGKKVGRGFYVYDNSAPS